MNLRHFLLSLPLILSLAPAARAVDAEGVSEDKTSRSLKPYDRKTDTTPADSAAAALKGFRRAKIPAGFKADLWASEPLLANPVAFSFDGKGRMFIAETHRYRTSVLDIRHYMFMLEDDLANRNQADREPAKGRRDECGSAESWCLFEAWLVQPCALRHGGGTFRLRDFA